LPRTFQDAILIARNLRLRYLWIDSLCIVQDDTQDWMTESAKMMDYYLKAHITISALRASDSQEGILGDRIIEKQLYIRSKREQLRTMFFDEPLNTRAWILQERLISTRIIHFGRHEMIWECNTCSARESGATDFQPGSLADIDKLEVWEHLVTDYLTRHITKNTDRLPAISGLARMLFEGSKFTYLASL
ncbi:heterokaryon incompatibility protein-domain-containing protein, partial [Leptodontidium sp. 2 PMI_412]